MEPRVAAFRPGNQGSPSEGRPRAVVRLTRDLLRTYGAIAPQLLEGDVFFERAGRQLGV